MIYASTTSNESDDSKVFVDSTGRRGKILAISGGIATLAAALYIGVVVTSVVQAPEAELTTKATVAATATASASASPSASASASASASSAPQTVPPAVVVRPGPPDQAGPPVPPPGPR